MPFDTADLAPQSDGLPIKKRRKKIVFAGPIRRLEAKLRAIRFAQGDYARTWMPNHPLFQKANKPLMEAILDRSFPPKEGVEKQDLENPLRHGGGKKNSEGERHKIIKHKTNSRPLDGSSSYRDPQKIHEALMTHTAPPEKPAIAGSPLARAEAETAKLHAHFDAMNKDRGVKSNSGEQTFVKAINIPDQKELMERGQAARNEVAHALRKIHTAKVADAQASGNPKAMPIRPEHWNGHRPRREPVSVDYKPATKPQKAKAKASMTRKGKPSPSQVARVNQIAAQAEPLAEKAAKTRRATGTRLHEKLLTKAENALTGMKPLMRVKDATSATGHAYVENPKRNPAGIDVAADLMKPLRRDIAGRPAPKLTEEITEKLAGALGVKEDAIGKIRTKIRSHYTAKPEQFRASIARSIAEKLPRNSQPVTTAVKAAAKAGSPILKRVGIGAGVLGAAGLGYAAYQRLKKPKEVAMQARVSAIQFATLGELQDLARKAGLLKREDHPKGRVVEPTFPQAWPEKDMVDADVRRGRGWNMPISDEKKSIQKSILRQSKKIKKRVKAGKTKEEFLTHNGPGIHESRDLAYMQDGMISGSTTKPTGEEALKISQIGANKIDKIQSAAAYDSDRNVPITGMEPHHGDLRNAKVGSTAILDLKPGEIIVTPKAKAIEKTASPILKKSHLGKSLAIAGGVAAAGGLAAYLYRRHQQKQEHRFEEPKKNNTAKRGFVLGGIAGAAHGAYQIPGRPYVPGENLEGRQVIRRAGWKRLPFANHVGIGSGVGSVIHVTGTSAKDAHVAEVDLPTFAKGRPIKVLDKEPSRHAADAARTEIGHSVNYTPGLRDCQTTAKGWRTGRSFVLGHQVKRTAIGAAVGAAAGYGLVKAAQHWDKNYAIVKHKTETMFAAAEVAEDAIGALSKKLKGVNWGNVGKAAAVGAGGLGVAGAVAGAAVPESGEDRTTSSGKGFVRDAIFGGVMAGASEPLMAAWLKPGRLMAKAAKTAATVAASARGPVITFEPKLTVAKDRYEKTIHEKEIDRRNGNFVKSAAAGGLVGRMSHAKLGMTRGKSALLGAAAGIGTQAIVRAATNRHDQFGDVTPEAKWMQRVPYQVAGIAGLAMAGRRAAEKMRAIVPSIKHLSMREAGTIYFDDEDYYPGSNNLHRMLKRKPKRVAEDLWRHGRHATELVTDIANEAKGGKKDGRGRPAKKTWEKPWFRNAVAVGGLAAVAGITHHTYKSGLKRAENHALALAKHEHNPIEHAHPGELDEVAKLADNINSGNLSRGFADKLRKLPGGERLVKAGKAIGEFTRSKTSGVAAKLNSVARDKTDEEIAKEQRHWQNKANASGEELRKHQSPITEEEKEKQNIIKVVFSHPSNKTTLSSRLSEVRFDSRIVPVREHERSERSDKGRSRGLERFLIGAATTAGVGYGGMRYADRSNRIARGETLDTVGSAARKLKESKGLLAAVREAKKKGAPIAEELLHKLA